MVFEDEATILLVCVFIVEEEEWVESDLEVKIDLDGGFFLFLVEEFKRVSDGEQCFINESFGVGVVDAVFSEWNRGIEVFEEDEDDEEEE
ncbi:hypothetical protein HMI56_001523 [Coelomomyces lativittatus]|nr:hypothetical protein HMI56_001523 [Coelomomyces lativittatus]